MKVCDSCRQPVTQDTLIFEGEFLDAYVMDDLHICDDCSVDFVQVLKTYLGKDIPEDEPVERDKKPRLVKYDPPLTKYNIGEPNPNSKEGKRLARDLKKIKDEEYLRDIRGGQGQDPSDPNSELYKRIHGEIPFSGKEPTDN